MNYLVLYDDENYTFIDAENVEDCIIQFAEKDYVDMYNHFSCCNIDSILIIQQILYDKEKEK